MKCKKCGSHVYNSNLFCAKCENEIIDELLAKYDTKPEQGDKPKAEKDARDNSTDTRKGV
jgi:hypothetical protein